MPGKIADLRKKLIAEAKAKVAEAYTARDPHVIKAVKVLDELDEVFNLLAEHAIEWYGFHFPELPSLLKDNEGCLQVALKGKREELKADKIDFVPEENRAKLLAAAEKSMGADLLPEDLAQIQLLSKNALALKEERQSLTDYLEKAMAELAPNFSELAGAVLAARILAQAGSMERLASLPSSTLQLLGAEKALFRHLQSGGKPPKHGFIYAHPLVRSMPFQAKGKMARSLAAKLSLAVREDFYGDKRIAADLKKDLEARASSLKK